MAVRDSWTIPLGVKIECAECHDHSFAKWTRQQFWETAAFFGPASEVRFPNTGEGVKARFLDGTAADGRALCDVFWALLNSGDFALKH